MYAPNYGTCIRRIMKTLSSRLGGSRAGLSALPEGRTLRRAGPGVGGTGRGRADTCGAGCVGRGGIGGRTGGHERDWRLEAKEEVSTGVGARSRFGERSRSWLGS